MFVFFPFFVLVWY